AKIKKAFRLIVCRTPSDKEKQLLQSYYADQLKIYGKNKQDAAKLLAVGEYPLNNKVNKTDMAAMMEVITAIYNLEETITRS
ncbi:MAG TPA: hypothetical protein VKB19_19215, partial [Pedobacter sp.]|nr:hypothetical protein [Pedobacter sp.]